MGILKLLRDGTWYLHSKSDPRWNVSGHGRVGMFAKPRECDDAEARLRETLGEPPDDLEWGYEKD